MDKVCLMNLLIFLMTKEICKLIEYNATIKKNYITIVFLHLKKKQIYFLQKNMNKYRLMGK